MRMLRPWTGSGSKRIRQALPDSIPLTAGSRAPSRRSPSPRSVALWPPPALITCNRSRP